MKKVLFSLALASLFACGEESSKQEVEGNSEETVKEVSYVSFGEEIDVEGTITAAELIEKMQAGDTVKAKVRGEIDEVCQMKGCWMDIKSSEGDYFSVKFKDYGFFVPKDAAGKDAIFEGVAFMDTVSVEELKHYAEDAEKSDSVINAITEPEITIGFTASGVLITDEK